MQWRTASSLVSLRHLAFDLGAPCIFRAFEAQVPEDQLEKEPSHCGPTLPGQSRLAMTCSKER